MSDIIYVFYYFHVKFIEPRFLKMSEESDLAHAQHATSTVNIQSEKADSTVVIKSLLCFVTNKMRVMPSESIIQLCENHFSAEDIEIAKKTLFYRFPDVKGASGETIKLLGRQGPKKNIWNLEDILKLLHHIDLSALDSPIFVTCDLDLPPITFNSIDVSMLLAKIEGLTDTVTMLQRGMDIQSDTCNTLSLVCKDLQSSQMTLSSKVESLEDRGIRESLRLVGQGHCSSPTNISDVDSVSEEYASKRNPQNDLPDPCCHSSKDTHILTERNQKEQKPEASTYNSDDGNETSAHK